jgi:hypothetical protein
VHHDTLTALAASTDGMGTETCGQSWGPPVGRTVDNLATAASTAVGTELVAGPTDLFRTTTESLRKLPCDDVRDKITWIPWVLSRIFRTAPP